MKILHFIFLFSILAAFLAKNIEVTVLNVDNQDVITACGDDATVYKYLVDDNEAFPELNTKLTVDTKKLDDGWNLKENLDNIKSQAVDGYQYTFAAKQILEYGKLNEERCKKNSKHHHLKQKKTESKSESQTKATYAYFYLADASDQDRKKNTQESQYFDKAKKVQDIKYTMTAKFGKTEKEFKKPEFADILSMNKKLSGFKSLTIKKAQLYLRTSGILPHDKVLKEMDKARKQPKSHTPSTSDAMKYFVLKTSVPENNQFIVKHLFLEIHCDGVDAQGKTVSNIRFVIDRGSHENPFNIWASRIRFVYLGIGDVWLNDKNECGSKIEKVDGPSNVADVDIMTVVKYSKKYLEAWPVYNTLTNCQHYGHNLYQELVPTFTQDYQAQKAMNSHSHGTIKNSNGKIAGDNFNNNILFADLKRKLKYRKLFQKRHRKLRFVRK